MPRTRPRYPEVFRREGIDFARRHLRGQWNGALVVTVVTVVAAAVVAVTSSGGRAATGLKIDHAAPSVPARGDPKPVPPPGSVQADNDRYLTVLAKSGDLTAVGVVEGSTNRIQLPRGGRTLLPGHLIVAFYGIVGTSNILGKTSDPEADAVALQRQARAYLRFGRPVQPAFELVTTVASPAPGPDGTYSAAIDRSTVQRYLDAAHRHKLLLILDFQPGRGEFLPEIRRYARFLVDPSVGVGLDPEWKLTGTQVPDQVIGSSAAAGINAVSAYLSRLIRIHQLPQKLFIIHEFHTSELPDRQNIVFRPGLATVLQMDGLGPVSIKLKSYRKVMRGARGFHPGFKVFLRPVDDPVLMAPGQIMELHPQPDYVSYQ